MQQMKVLEAASTLIERNEQKKNRATNHNNAKRLKSHNNCNHKQSSTKIKLTCKSATVNWIITQWFSFGITHRPHQLLSQFHFKLERRLKSKFSGPENIIQQKAHEHWTVSRMRNDDSSDSDIQLQRHWLSLTWAHAYIRLFKLYLCTETHGQIDCVTVC